MHRIGDGISADGHILIVGGGPAAYATATELRRLGFPGEVSVACAEQHMPYDRPSCSKGLLSGHQVPGDVMLDRVAGVEWRLGRRAQWADPGQQVVGFDTGETCRYDGLVVATGTTPVVPDALHVGERGLHLLHTLQDAWRLREELRYAQRVAVVGGGLTGCEVACAVRELARDVVLIHAGSQPMEKTLGTYVGELVAEEHRAAGIDLRLATRVVALDRAAGQWRLRLDDDNVVFADLVVVTAGERPAVSWLAESGIDCTDGVLCDERLRVAGAPGVVAAGAVARWPDPRCGEGPARIGHWIAALEHGREAARTLLGAATEPVSVLPRFWSEQLGLRIQVCGRIPADADIAVSELRPGRRNSVRRGLVATYYAAGQAVGVVGINAPQGFTFAARALAAGLLMPERALPAAAPPRRRLHAVS